MQFLKLHKTINQKYIHTMSKMTHSRKSLCIVKCHSENKNAILRPKKFDSFLGVKSHCAKIMYSTSSTSHQNATCLQSYKIMSQRLLETDFPSTRNPSIIKRSGKPGNLNLRPVSTSGSMPKNLSATEWQYEPSFGRNSGSMSRVQTSFDVNPRHAALPHNVGGPPPGPNRTGSLKKALTTSDEDDEVDSEETRPLQRLPKPQVKPNNSHSSTSDYHSDENPNLLPVEHRELPGFRLQHFNNRHRKSDDEEMSGGARCCFGFLTFLAQILLHGVVGLVLFWVTAYHSKDKVPFSWRTDPELEWNLHPVLMILGFIYFMGQAMLMYRTCRCCRRIWSKLLHTIFHLLAAPCIALGFVATWDYHNLRTDNDGNPNPIPNFYSLHSWMGLTTMGLFALQFIVGFFSFLLLLCCESATASFRAALVPIHSTFGITTFVMAVATSCTGLIEKAFFTLSSDTENIPQESNVIDSIKEPDQYDYYADEKPVLYKGIADLYTELPNEAIIVNTIAVALVALAILMPCILKCDAFRKGLENEADVDSDVE